MVIRLIAYCTRLRNFRRFAKVIVGVESGAGEKEVELLIECAGNDCLQGLPMCPNGESRAAELIALIPLDSVEVARVQCDTQADEYKQSKLAPWHQYIEKHSADNLISVIGGVEGKKRNRLGLRRWALFAVAQRREEGCWGAWRGPLRSYGQLGQRRGGLSMYLCCALSASLLTIGLPLTSPGSGLLYSADTV